MSGLTLVVLGDEEVVFAAGAVPKRPRLANVVYRPRHMVRAHPLVAREAQREGGHEKVVRRLRVSRAMRASQYLLQQEEARLRGFGLRVEGLSLRENKPPFPRSTRGKGFAISSPAGGSSPAILGLRF
eukprot:1144004-Pyramimonas_sp.AAC.1